MKIPLWYKYSLSTVLSVHIAVYYNGYRAIPVLQPVLISEVLDWLVLYLCSVRQNGSLFIASLLGLNWQIPQYSAGMVNVTPGWLVFWNKVENTKYSEDFYNTVCFPYSTHNSQKTLHSSPVRVSYGVSFMSSWCNRCLYTATWTSLSEKSR